MSSDVSYVKNGIRVQCNVSQLPAPRPRAIWPLSTLQSNLASLLVLELVSIAGQGAAGIQVSSAGPLPGSTNPISGTPTTSGSSGGGHGSSPAYILGGLAGGNSAATWTLYHQAYQGNPTTLPNAETLPITLDSTNNFALLLSSPLANATHNFWLTKTDGGTVATYPTATIQTPPDSTQGNIETAQATADSASSAASTAQTTANAAGAAASAAQGTASAAQTSADSASSAASAAQTTATGAQTGVTQINSIACLSNAQKITLMQQWGAELALQAQLDSMAFSVGVSASAYDSAIATFSTNLIAAGAPANWQTTWPDGTTTNLTGSTTTDTISAWWATIASARKTLENSITNTKMAITGTAPNALLLAGLAPSASGGANTIAQLNSAGGLSASTLNLSATTVSTTSSTGALVVAGGVGVGGALYAANIIGFSGSSSPSGTGFTLGLYTGNYGWLQTWGGVPLYLNPQGNAVEVGSGGATLNGPLAVNSASGVNISGGNITFDTSAERHVHIDAVGSYWGLFLNTTSMGLFDWTNNRSVYRYIAASNSVVISPKVGIIGGTPATSPTTGDLTTTGGIGIGGSIYAGGRIQSQAAPQSWGVYPSTIAGLEVVQGTSNSASWLIAGTSNGSFTAGIQALDAGGYLRYYVGSSYIQQTLAGLSIPATTASTGTTSGALTVAGGIGAQGAANFGGNCVAGGFAPTSSSTSYGLGFNSNFGVYLQGHPGGGSSDLALLNYAAQTVLYVPTGTQQTIFAGKVTFAPATASSASLNLPPGSRPTSPASGDLYLDTTGNVYLYASSTWEEFLTTGNVNSQPAAIQALAALLKAPTVGPLPLPTLPSTSYPAGAYYYATNDTSADGNPGTLWQTANGTTWTMIGASVLIGGRVIAGNLTAGSVGATALATNVQLVNQVIQSGAYQSGGAGISSLGVAGNGTGVPSGWAIYGQPQGTKDCLGNAFNAIAEFGGAINLAGYQLNELGVAKLYFGTNGNWSSTTPGNWSWTAPPIWRPNEL